MIQITTNPSLNENEKHIQKICNESYFFFYIKTNDVSDIITYGNIKRRKNTKYFAVKTHTQNIIFF